ncbi:unnamed protein product [Diabrotica balteata]|uniref:Elongation of very long chain fatty acids protein n=1 Tax=Diabrotica balteata TaxID=107213 RepID=A0A9N9T6T4_DIABA|nr:unnamed protein product [Diabrotica balteata]
MAILTDILNDFTSNIDPKHEDYVVSSPDFFCSFVLFYVFSIRVLGPKLMQHRQPYNIKNLVIGYNVIQILVNIYIVYECIYVYFTNPNWICIDARPKQDFANVCKHYYFLKLFDIVETIQLNMMWIYFGLTKLTPGCKTMPRYVLYMWIAQNLFMVSLFLKFYFKTYVKKEVSVSKEE